MTLRERGCHVAACFRWRTRLWKQVYRCRILLIHLPSARQLSSFTFNLGKESLWLSSLCVVASQQWKNYRKLLIWRLQIKIHCGLALWRLFGGTFIKLRQTNKTVISFLTESEKAAIQTITLFLRLLQVERHVNANPIWLDSWPLIFEQTHPSRHRITSVNSTERLERPESRYFCKSGITWGNGNLFSSLPLHPFPASTINFHLNTRRTEDGVANSPSACVWENVLYFPQVNICDFCCAEQAMQSSEREKKLILQEEYF